MSVAMLGGLRSLWSGDERATMAELWAALEQGDAPKLRQMLQHISPVAQVAVAANSGSSGTQGGGDAAVVRDTPGGGDANTHADPRTVVTPTTTTTATATTPRSGLATTAPERELRRGVFELLQYAVVRGDVEATAEVLAWIAVSCAHQRSARARMRLQYEH